MKTEINDRFKESLRQKTQLENTISYLEETKPTCICLKSEGVLDRNQVWISALNLDLIDTKTLAKKLKRLTIKHLKRELETLESSHEVKRQRKVFINHPD